jgi:hypothetical protein
MRPISDAYSYRCGFSRSTRTMETPVHPDAGSIHDRPSYIPLAPEQSDIYRLPPTSGDFPPPSSSAPSTGFRPVYGRHTTRVDQPSLVSQIPPSNLASPNSYAHSVQSSLDLSRNGDIQRSSPSPPDQGHYLPPALIPAPPEAISSIMPPQSANYLVDQNGLVNMSRSPYDQGLL